MNFREADLHFPENILQVILDKKRDPVKLCSLFIITRDHLYRMYANIPKETNIYYPLKYALVCSYQGVKNAYVLNR